MLSTGATTSPSPTPQSIPRIGLHGRYLDGDSPYLKIDFPSTVARYTVGEDGLSEMASTKLSNGNVLVFWQKMIPTDASSVTLLFAIYTDEGTPVTSILSVDFNGDLGFNEFSGGASNGKFLLAWRSGFNIYGRYHSNDGTPLGDALQINDVSAASYNPFIIAINSEESLVVFNTLKAVYGQFMNGNKVGSNLDISDISDVHKTKPKGATVNAVSYTHLTLPTNREV